MNETTNSMSDLARNNKTAMTAHLVDVTVMTTFCVLQAAGGSQSWLYVLIVAVLGFAPIAAEYYFWKNSHETPLIKHLVAIGFAVFYTYTLFTSANQLVFVFVIPMILVVSIYNDAKYTLLINIGVVLESLLVVIIGSSTGRFGYLGMDYGIIQIVIVILIGIYSFFTAKTLNLNMEQKVTHIAEAQSQTELVLQDLSLLSEKIKSGINDIYIELGKLKDSSMATKNAMQEVSDGAADTAQAVQKQLLQTESIQKKVDMVDTATGHITDNMQQTLTVLNAGNQDVELLVRQVDVSVQNGADVAEKLKTLDQYIKEMNSIVELISGIAGQTGLLALNASIEAARAGEAGRGFAVVASEISSMATQTNDATTHITNLIQNVASAINEVVSVIYQMIEGIHEEKQSTEHTEVSFDSIQTNTFSIRDNVDSLAGHITDLKDANRVIADSIQTISAISEEVSAHAAETMHAEEENESILEHIDERMQELMELIKQS